MTVLVTVGLAGCQSFVGFSARGTVIEDRSSELAMGDIGSLEGESLTMEMRLDLRADESEPYEARAFHGLQWEVGPLDVDYAGGVSIPHGLAFGTGGGVDVQPTVNGVPGTFLMFIPGDGVGANGVPVVGDGEWWFSAALDSSRRHEVIVSIEAVEPF